MLLPPALAQVAASLVAPGLAVAGLAAVAVPVTLHLLSKRRRRQRPWAAMRFLREAIEKQRRRLRFERWLLLACRCLALALLGLALAGPLVGGRLASALGVAGAAGRSVDLVLDNGIAAGAVEQTGGPTALEAKRAQALALLGTLSPEDRVRVWPLAGGPEAPADLTPAAAAAAVEAVEPTDVAPAWGAVTDRAVDAARADAAAGREAALVVLSPFFAGDGSLAADRGGRGGGADTGPDADSPRVLLARPAPGRENLQVAAVRPARSVVAVGAGGAGGVGGRLEAQVEVRRAGASAGGGSGRELDAGVVVELVDAPTGEAASVDELAGLPVLARGTGRLTLGPGVEAATARVTLEALDSRAGLGLGAGLLRARLSEEAGDAVAADDVALDAVRRVEAVRVGLLGGDSAPGGGDAGGIGPADFFGAALGAGEAGGFLPRPLGSASELRRGGPDALDAVLVLNPAALGPAGREAVAGFAAAGGAVWVTPSAEPAGDDPEAAGRGLEPLFEALGLPWRVAAPGPAPGPDVSEGEARRADAGAPPPPALPLLAGQWEALLRPLRFDRVVALSGVDPAGVWIRLNPEAGPDAEAAPALAAAFAAGPQGEAEGSVGGRVLFLAAAADPAWTNLPAKPLFPALVRDALLEAVSAADRRPRVVAGAADAGLQAGVTATAGGGLAVVHPAVDAADTTGLPSARAAARFAGVGEVAFLPGTGADRIFPEASARASLAGGLLWVVLGLLVLEALAGRAFTRGGAG